MYIIRKKQFFFTFDACKPVVGDSKIELRDFKIAEQWHFKY